MKFNEYASVVVSAGYDRSLRAWDCRSHSTEPIQVDSLSSLFSVGLSVPLTRNFMSTGFFRPINLSHCHCC